MTIASRVFYLVVCFTIIITSARAQAASAGSELHVHIIASEPISLIYFVDKLAAKGFSSECLRKWWSTHRGFTRQDRQALDRYRTLIQSRFNAYRFTGELKQNRTLPDQLEYLAAESSTVQEFLERLRPSVNQADYNTVRSIVNHFEPLYESLVWKPANNRFRLDIEHLNDSLSNLALCEHLQKVAAIYNSHWPDKVTLVVAIVILPQQSNTKLGRDAHCNGALNVVEISPNQAPSEKWGTIFHELTHSLWMATPQNSKDCLRKQFITAHGSVAYSRLPEALATALGAGWFMSSTTGKVDKYWYDDHFIKGYAESLLPLLKDYLTKGKQLDQTFAIKATEAFKRRFHILVNLAGDSHFKLPRRITTYFV